MIALLARLRRRRFVYSSSSLVDFSYARLEPARIKVAAFELGVRLANRVVVQTDEQAVLCRERFRRPATVIRSIAEVAPKPAGPPPREAFLWVGRAADYKGPLEYVDLARAARGPLSHGPGPVRDSALGHGCTMPRPQWATSSCSAPVRGPS